jgi:serine protease Do
MNATASPRARAVCGSCVFAALLTLITSTIAQTPADDDVATSHPATGIAASDSARLTQLAAAQQRVFRAAVDRLSPCIVRIETIGGALPVERSGDPEEQGPVAPRFRQADGPTTGLICSQDGLIITSSFNFLRSPTVITVRLGNGRRYVAKLLARDPAARLALLKIDAADLPTPTWVSRQHLRPGQWLLTAGYGHGGRTPLVSVGVLSAVDRMGGLALQSDAKTSPANYGGPLFDIDGRVAGVCVPISGGPADEIAGLEWYDSGIGFAVHSDYIRLRVPQMATGRDVQRAVLGVNLDPRDPLIGGERWLRAGPGRARPADRPPGPPGPPIADAPLDANAPPPAEDGVRLMAPPRGPAAKVGLQQGDVITHLDGAPTPRLIALRRILIERSPGDEIEVTYRRGDVSGIARLSLVSEAELAAASAPASQSVTQPAATQSN